MENNSALTTDVKKEAMIDALEVNYGNVTAAARAAKINPRTHYRWLKEDRQYANEAENIRDISFRKLKDKLVAAALKKIDKGDTAILNKMLGIYLKNIPEEMMRVSRENNVPLLAVMKYVDKPQDPRRNEE